MLKAQSVNFLFLLLLLLVVAFNYFVAVPWYVYLILGLVYLTITAVGSFNILLNYHVNALNYQPKPTGKQIALSFDDGPHADTTPQILDLLKHYGVKASFFCIGKHLEAQPAIAARIVAEGHIIANHTYHHANHFGFLNTKEVLQEINKTDEVIERLTKRKARLFRPPFGVTNPSIRKAVEQSGHWVIGWNNRSLDTVLKPHDKVVERVVSRLKAGDIVLLHDTIPQTIVVLEEILLFLQKNKYEAVSLDTLLKIKAYA